LTTSLKVVLEIQSYQLSIIGSEREEPMRTQYIAALAVTTGFGLGAIAVEGLHAQATPAAYVVSEINVTDRDGFAKEFLPTALKALAGSGMKALARGGKVVSIFGDPPKGLAVINIFDSLDKAVAAYNSPDYKAAKVIGDKYATFRTYAVEALPQ
jgi:uncharacterized protein (DUF1330 family)